jgi:uncharacterized protein (DUF58 family)
VLIRATTKRPKRIEDLIDGRFMARLERLDLRTRKVFPGKLQGERRSKRRGQSVEFEDYRNYTPGDDLRFIDWNVYARLDRLFIKIFQEEEDLALHVAIDASASMDAGDPTKREMAARIAIALAYLGLVNQNRVGLSVFGAPGQAGVSRFPDSRGRHSFRRLGQFLIDSLWPASEATRPPSAGEARGPGPGGSFNEALSLIARMRVGKGVFVILSDCMDPHGYEEGLKTLAAAGGYDTYCLQLLSKTELDPSTDPETGLVGDLRLIDAESGRPAEVTVSTQLIKRYKARLERFCADLESFCAARAISHLLVRTETPVEQLVLETLRRRGVLG